MIGPDLVEKSTNWAHKSQSLWFIDEKVEKSVACILPVFTKQKIIY